MENKRLRTLAIEIFKTINNINLSFMKDIFTPKKDPKIRFMTPLIDIMNLQSMVTKVF